MLIYTSWTRTDSQQKLLKLLRKEGYCTDILTPRIETEKREEWVEKRVKSGLQVLITNPRCVETGLDLNAFTTLIFYSMGYNLFTLRQASRRSWRINQTAPRVEVYMLYYADTMQAKAMNRKDFLSTNGCIITVFFKPSIKIGILNKILICINCKLIVTFNFRLRSVNPTVIQDIRNVT